jgi:hypothetical protein
MWKITDYNMDWVQVLTDAERSRFSSRIRQAVKSGISVWSEEVPFSRHIERLGIPKEVYNDLTGECTLDKGGIDDYAVCFSLLNINPLFLSKDALVLSDTPRRQLSESYWVATWSYLGGEAHKDNDTYNFLVLGTLAALLAYLRSKRKPARLESVYPMEPELVIGKDEWYIRIDVKRSSFNICRPTSDETYSFSIAEGVFEKLNSKT